MMALRALAAFLVLPDAFSFLLPLVIAQLDPFRLTNLGGGMVVVAVGALILLWCVRDFYISGKGTLDPWDLPKQLVVVGLYRYVRNPMYVGVVLLVLGWTLAFGSPLIAAYTIILALGFHLRGVMAEKPRLARQFGAAWVDYTAAVPRWLPRVTAWKMGS